MRKGKIFYPIAFAGKAYRGKYRKGREIPYIYREFQKEVQKVFKRTGLFMEWGRPKSFLDVSVLIAIQFRQIIRFLGKSFCINL